MYDEKGNQVGQIVRDVKSAFRTVRDEMTGSGVRIKGLDLVLEGVVTNEGGGDFKFKIFGKELGVEGKVSKEDLTKVSISLAPEGPAAQEAQFNVEADLVESIRLIIKTAKGAAEEEPKFKLGEASVELSFEITKEGSVNFFAEAGRKSVATHTITLTLEGSGTDGN